MRTESRAREIEEKWDTPGSRLDYVRAVLARASLYRQRKGRERAAMKLINGADYLLRGLSQDENWRIVNLLLHQTLSWKVRLRTFYLPERELDAEAIEEDFKRLHELAEKSDSPIPAIVTARDEAAYWVLHDEFDKAGIILRQARSQYNALPVKSVIADLALRRSEIEFEVKLIKLGEKKAGGKEVRLVREYHRIWKQNPTAAQLKALRDLEKKCQVSPARVEGLRRVYSTPMPAELWMEDRLLRL
ncbi:MAG: hypothetical protein EPN47_13840 [Acidobacteria bacterium]|nr:MAG: hypothetical protein EPN47_13840 [Acidobacteriota bacterium]